MEAIRAEIMKKIVPILLILAIQGCASNKPTMYEWGHYEKLIYKGYSDPGKLFPEEHIEKLMADYEIARSENKAVPPGWHAQLGMLYYQAGKLSLAEQSFVTEMTLFPESAQFMKRLIEKIKRGS